MRKIITLFATLAMILALFATPALADTSPATITSVFTIGSMTYTVNGVPQQMDVAPVIVNGRTLMPARFLAYSLGLNDTDVQYQQTWNWNPTLSAVDVFRPRADGSKLEVTMYYSTTDSSKDGMAPVGAGRGGTVKFDVPPEVVPPGRLMVPYRYLAQALGAIVSWNQDTQQVTVKTWQTLPAVPTALTANQVSMSLGGSTVTATENGSQVGQWSYPYPVDIANPYYPGPNEEPHIVAVVPTLEAFGVPTQNILWDPDSQTLMVAGSRPYQFVYLTPNGDDTNIVSEYASPLIPSSEMPAVAVAQNGVLYADGLAGALVADTYNVYTSWNNDTNAIQAHNGINIQN